MAFADSHTHGIWDARRQRKLCASKADQTAFGDCALENSERSCHQRLGLQDQSAQTKLFVRLQACVGGMFITPIFAPCIAELYQLERADGILKAFEIHLADQEAHHARTMVARVLAC